MGNPARPTTTTFPRTDLMKDGIMKAVTFAVFALVLALSSGGVDSDIGVTMKFNVGDLTYSSHATHREMQADKWKVGEKEKASYSSVITSAKKALATSVNDIEDWNLDELAFRSDYQDGLWYWSVTFINGSLNKDKKADVALLGVHLDGTSFHLTKE